MEEIINKNIKNIAKYLPEKFYEIEKIKSKNIKLIDDIKDYLFRNIYNKKFEYLEKMKNFIEENRIDEDKYVLKNENLLNISYNSDMKYDIIKNLLFFNEPEICISKIIILFPLKNLIFEFDIKKDLWTNKNIFDSFFSLNNDENDDFEEKIVEKYKIGLHIGKLKTLESTILNIKNIEYPYQIFLGSSISKNFNISDEDIEKTNKLIKEKNMKIFVHLPYIFNLATKNDNYIHIKKFLDISFKCGFKGCVIHVPKQTNLTFENAFKNTKENILNILPSINKECPLLFETPASQGSEMFTNMKDFVDFVNEINDERLRICLDTAHVFSSKYIPSDYIKYIIKINKKLLKLIHFNDSKACF